MLWKCPNHHDVEFGVVCGGSEPYYLRDPDIEMGNTGNIYFYMDLETGELTKYLYTDYPGFNLTDEDWATMHEHARGGCASEPQCSECGEQLLPAEQYDAIVAANKAIEKIISNVFQRANETLEEVLFTKPEVHHQFLDIITQAPSYFKQSEAEAIIKHMETLSELFGNIGIAFLDTEVSEWIKDKTEIINSLKNIQTSG